MNLIKIQSMQSLKNEMLAVARGECGAPADATQTSFESVEAFRLLATINQKKLASATEPSKLIRR